MSASKILFFLCLSFIAGIFLESAFKIPQIFIWGFLLLGILIIISFLFSKKYFIFGFFVLLFAIGILRVQISEFNIASDKLSQLNGKGQVVLSGTIIDEPDVRDTSQKLKVKIGNSVILATTSRYPGYKYLDKIKITGKLEEPSVTDEFNYKNYLMKDGIYSVMGFPKIEIIGKENKNLFSGFYVGILDFKQKMDNTIEKYFSPPQSMLLQGIILGNNKNMTQDLQNELNTTGLRFLTAISGVHVVILSIILMSFLLALGFYRGQAFYLSVVIIWLYVVLTGFSASGIRAATMGSILLLAEKLGRQNTSSRTIVLAGALMLLQNPLLLIYDIGFQLSFAAALGIIYFKPLADAFLKFIFKDKLKSFSSVAAMTLTAQLFTLPVMIYGFGQMSFIAPLSNILILPVFYYILVFGFLFAIFGAFSNILGWIFYFPLYILITYFLKVMDFLNRPWALKTINNVSWIWLAASYLFIGVLTWYLNKKTAARF